MSAVVLQLVVEQCQFEIFHARFDDQLVDVGQLAGDAHRSTGDRAGEGRESRLEETDVGIERRPAESQRQLGVHLLGHRDASGARECESWRCGFEVECQQLTAHGEMPGDLADALISGKEVDDADADVVGRHLEGPGAGGFEAEEAGQAARSGRRRSSAIRPGCVRHPR